MLQNIIVDCRYKQNLLTINDTWNLTNPNSLGPLLVRIREIFGLVK